jgi:hypothetical protein
MKFKVGDLVQLSAAGKKSGQNSHALGGFGIVYFIGESCADYPIHTNWLNGVEFKDGQIRRVNFKTYELKFFKKSS